MANTFMTKMLVFLAFLLQLASSPGRVPGELWDGLRPVDMFKAHTEEALRSQWPKTSRKNWWSREKLGLGLGRAGRLELS